MKPAGQQQPEGEHGQQEQDHPLPERARAQAAEIHERSLMYRAAFPRDRHASATRGAGWSASRRAPGPAVSASAKMR